MARRTSFLDSLVPTATPGLCEPYMTRIARISTRRRKEKDVRGGDFSIWDATKAGLLVCVGKQAYLDELHLETPKSLLRRNG